ncbi:MAG: Bax inhibitor-1 family protein [Myxococcota bacterium]
MNQNYYSQSRSHAQGRVATSRERFIVKTYNHLFGAILLFTAIEIGLFMSGAADAIARVVAQNWFIALGAFMLAGWVGRSVAASAQSLAKQYVALVTYVVVNAIIFVPMLWVADRFAPGAIQSAAWITLLGFAALTGIAFWTRKDFSFLGGLLRWGGIMAIVAIIGAMIFGFHLGTWFSVAMVGLAGAAILYDTSNILRHYPET